MEAAQGLFAWLLCCWLRPVIKGFLRVTTRLCELQRVCYGERAGAPRTMAVGAYGSPFQFLPAALAEAGLEVTFQVGWLVMDNSLRRGR